MKTKKFRIATAGQTIDGRDIDEKWLTDMAASYDPATYAAPVLIEHIYGVSPDSPFRCYGVVEALEVGDADVNFNGKTERRKALYAVADVTDGAKELAESGRKMFPSMSVEENFAGKGFAYLAHLAMTDRPASIATEKMNFSCVRPDAKTVMADKPEFSVAIEFATAAPEGEGADSFIAGFGKMLETTFGKLGVGKPEEKPAPNLEETPNGEFSIDALKTLFEGMSTQFATALTGIQTQIAEKADQDALRFQAIEQRFENTPAHQYTPRPPATGAHGAQAKTDC